MIMFQVSGLRSHMILLEIDAIFDVNNINYSEYEDAGLIFFPMRTTHGTMIRL